MGYTDIIAQQDDIPNPDKKSQQIDYIKHIKERSSTAGGTSASRTPEEIEALFRSFNVDTRGYKFDREDANAR